MIKNNVDEWGYYDVAQCTYLHGIYLSRQKSKQNIDFKDFEYEDVAEEDIDKGIYGEKLKWTFKDSNFIFTILFSWFILIIIL